LDDAKDLTPEERGEMLLKSKNNEALNLITAHQELAMEGQTEVYMELKVLLSYIIGMCAFLQVNPNEQVNHHFVALIEKDGHLYELDGRKEFPINHGLTTQATFLEVYYNFVLHKFLNYYIIYFLGCSKSVP
jgi:ubiquitin carboxyl-terminal hydrolase L3